MTDLSPSDIGSEFRRQELRSDLKPDPRNDPQHLLQTQRSGSLYTTCGSWHLIHDTHALSFLTRPPPHTIHRALNADGITALNVFCIPFHPVTLHHLKTDNLTILPASYETLSARWEMTDLKSSRRATL